MNMYPIIPYLAIIVIIAVAVRVPFLRFPMDEDFATYFYRARFAHLGLEWKRDMYVFFPTWRMLLLDLLYARPETGVLRVRVFLLGMHVITSIAMFSGVALFTGNPLAAFVAGALYAFLATAPAFSAESFNFEQIFLPFLLICMQLMWLGPEMFPLAGLCLGIVVVAKITTGVFIPAMTVFAAYRYGLHAAGIFAAWAASLPLISYIIEWAMGYLDAEARKQFSLRMIISLRCSQLKQMYGSIPGDLKLVVLQTLPLWVFGCIGLVISFARPEGLLVALFAATVLFMIVCQRGFSRYHYVPWIATLAIGTGEGMSRFLQAGGATARFAWIILAALTSWSVFRLLPFYLRPLDARNLSRYEKFDQFIYIPYLGKVLNRLIRMRKETHRRIFVWGNYVQLYHLTGLPAADQYVHYSIGPWDKQPMTGYFDTVIGGLIRHKPIYLIKAFSDFDVSLIEVLTGLKYQLVKVALARFPVYRLIGHTPPENDPLALPWEEKLRLMDMLTQGPHVPDINRADADAGWLNKAANECRKLHRLNPWDYRGLAFLAELYDRLGRFPEAAVAYGKLIRLRSTAPLLRLLQAKQNIEQGRFDAAKVLIEEEIRLFGDNDETEFYQGLMQFRKTLWTQAKNHFERTLKFNPGHTHCLLYLGETLMFVGMADAARRMFTNLWERARGPEGEWLRAKAAMGMANLDAGMRPESKTLEYYIVRDPDNEILAYAGASALEREGDLETARTLFDRFAHEFTKAHVRAGALFRLARLSSLFDQGHLLKECLKLNPRHAGAMNLLLNPEISRVA